MGMQPLGDVIVNGRKLPSDQVGIRVDDIGLLRGYYDDHLAFMTIGSATSWPAVFQVTAALMVGEFLLWLHHLVRHKVRTLWVFHAVHHSQCTAVL